MNLCPVDPSIAEKLELGQFVAIGPGISGASVFHCNHRDGDNLILRLWPSEMTEPRLCEITRLMASAKSVLPGLVPAIFPLERESLRDELRRSSLFRADTFQRDNAQKRSTRLDQHHLTSKSLTLAEGQHQHASATSESIVSRSLSQMGLRISGAPFWNHSNGRYWQLFEKIPGDSLKANAPIERVMEGVDAIRRLHDAFADFGEKVEMPLAIRNRLRRLDQVHQRLGGSLSKAGIRIENQQLRSAVEDAIRIWNQREAEMKRRIFANLNQDSQCPQKVQYVLRDIHRGNLFFEGDRVAGFFDFDAVRVDTPWADLARWIGSFVSRDTHTEDWWEIAATSFVKGHPTLREADVKWGQHFARRLHHATTWISLANWLVWLCLEKRVFAAPAGEVATRIKELSCVIDQSF